MNIEVLGKTPTDNLPKGHTFQEIQAQELPEVEWVLPHTIPSGFTLRAGAPKEGKSALSEWEACVMDKPVAYFALEYNERLLAQRLQKLGACGLNPQHARFWNQYEVLESGLDPVDFIKRVVRNVGPSLVVVDTLAAIKKMTGGGYQEEYASMQEIKGISDSYGAGLLVNHHTRKRGESTDEDGSWVDRIMGSTGIAASADTVQLLERVEMATRLRMKGRMVPDMDMFFSFDNGVFTPQDGDLIALKVLEAEAPTSAAVAYILRDHESMTMAQIQTFINQGLKPTEPTYRPANSIYQSLKTLQKRGLAKSGGRRGAPWNWTGPTPNKSV